MNDTAIRVDGLSRAFGDIHAVVGLTLSVPVGEIFGLVGPDGAGKTTTMRLMTGLLRPDAGSVRIAGVDVVAETGRAHHLLGYLPQTFALLGDLTVAENIQYFADLYCVPRPDIAPRADELLQATGLAEFTSRRAHALSGGMKQKLALVCSLIHRPKVLLLDEPTRGVDPVSRRDLWRIIYGLPTEGVTVLVATPYADEAERCARLGVMTGGRLVDVGTPQEVVARHVERTIELQVDDQPRARDLLRAMPGVETVAVLGDMLRVSVTGGTDAQALRSELARAGLAVRDARPVEPRLDDALLAISAGVIADG
ncbi:MAG: ABC transporter ATP-binding protein [Armatimonadetes bacterium]|nr:ABC transporter ATP-binding protein [Armatimonadota bacterium]